MRGSTNGRRLDHADGGRAPQTGNHLTPLEEERIQRHSKSLEKKDREVSQPSHGTCNRRTDSPAGVRVDLRLALGPLGGHLVSHQDGPSADVAVKAAIDDVKRQLERRLANQRGESSFGVPSRGLPSELRPHPVNGPDDLEEDEFEQYLDLEDEEVAIPGTSRHSRLRHGLQNEPATTAANCAAVVLVAQICDETISG